MGTTSGEPAIPQAYTRVIALDGGTSNTRARLILDGRVVATARRTVGVRDSVLGDRSPGQSLAEAIRDVIVGAAGTGDGPERDPTAPPLPDLIVASGMLSSEVGLLAVPHVFAPAGLAELAGAVVSRTLPQVWSRPIHFVPGVRTPADNGPDGWMQADLMRGEECETLGALTELARRSLIEPGEQGMVLVWPGSHTKLVQVGEHGRITRSQTTLAGELIQSVARHTLIAASLPAELPTVLDVEMTDAGGRASQKLGLARAAFLVRVASVLGTMSQDQRASFWIGAVVAHDVGHLARHSILAQPLPVWVGGRQPLRSLYARWLAGALQRAVSPLDDEISETASALGALAIVRYSIDSGRLGASQPSLNRLHDQTI
jgi:2-dehydro-3-deoxygalactonokinase